MHPWTPSLSNASELWRCGLILSKNIYMLFAGWEVRMVKNCDRGLENTARGRRHVSTFWVLFVND